MNKRLKYNIAFGGLLIGSVILNDAAWSHSNLFDGFADLLPVLPFLFFGYYMLLICQRGTAQIIRRITHRISDEPSIAEFTPTILLSLLLLYGVYSSFTFDPFTHFIQPKRPDSVHDVRYWQKSGFGYTKTIIFFRIAPEDMELLLHRLAYQRNECLYPSDFPNKIHSFAPLDFANKNQKLPIPQPTEKIKWEYHFQAPAPSGGLNIEIYTNEKMDMAYYFHSAG